MKRSLWLAAAALSACSAQEPAPDGGLRCDGEGCVPRAAAAFACAQGRCRQPFPRRPDDGEWECVDLEGAVVCRGGAAPAGVVPGPPDRGWRCGARAGQAPERICVDVAPDLPDDRPARWTCTFLHDPVEARVCEERREPRPPCAGRRCPPPRPEPACWVDPDCGPLRVCVQGTCVDG